MGRRPAHRVRLRFAVPLAACGVLMGAVVIATAAPAAVAPPSAPTITTVIAGPADWSMYLRWAKPHSAGGAPITGYEYRVQIDSGPYSLPAALAAGNVTRATAPCVAPAAVGHGCMYQVRATNGSPGTWSTPVGLNWQLPSTPTLGRSLAGPAVGQATLSWRAPKTNGGLPLDYQYQVNGGSGWSGPTTISPGSIAVVPGRRPTLTAAVPCTITGPVSGCSYILNAINGVGASGPSRTKTAPLRKPGPPTDLQIVTDSVALATGAATQSISWVAPTNLGGLALTDYVVAACSTALGSACFNDSLGWALFDDIVGNPPATNATHDCPASGRCAYEVWAKNPKGKGWVWAFARPSSPITLTATASTTTTGQVDLQWVNPFDIGSSFGHYVLFECGATQACTNGDWTNDPLDAAPWTRVELSGTATTASYPCGVVNACTFRVGYVDGAGGIGGVTNSVSLVGA